jgi:hypothetical protein
MVNHSINHDCDFSSRESRDADANLSTSHQRLNSGHRCHSSDAPHVTGIINRQSGRSISIIYRGSLTLQTLDDEQQLFDDR